MTTATKNQWFAAPRATAIALAAALAVGCAADDPHKRAKTGAVIGGIAGAVIGHQTNSKNGKVVGAAVGALTGAAVGNYMDKQQRKLERQLAAERRANEIQLTRIDEDTIRLDVSSEASFAVNSASVQSGFRDSLNTMSAIIAEYEKTAVHVIGHTDSTGSSAYNQQLSEKRARSVSRYLGNNGVLQSRMRAAGRGENQPVASNKSAAGRSENRRVEIYLKAIVKGREAEASRPPV
ncbi:MAG: OmpA family protein [Gammaproteobacteria bacterium]|nr:OmpA family protein [Gammaproteobacteria bacterium]